MNQELAFSFWHISKYLPLSKIWTDHFNLIYHEMIEILGLALRLSMVVFIWQSEKSNFQSMIQSEITRLEFGSQIFDEVDNINSLQFMKPSFQLSVVFTMGNI
jgi:hypothetical protein